MAPGEVKLNEFPDTLPEDFAEWDGGGAQPAGVAPIKQAPVTNGRPAGIAVSRNREGSGARPRGRSPGTIKLPAARQRWPGDFGVHERPPVAGTTYRRVNRN